MTQHNMPKWLNDLVEQWPSTIVARSEIHKFSGGMLHPRTMANLDCRGAGPRGRVVMGRRVAYPVSDLVVWLAERSTEHD